MNPKKILMLKGHSAGIGDILRSSAAWRSLKEKFPDASLNLVFLSNHMNYPSHTLIENHHLLDTFFVLDKNKMQNPKGIIENSKEFIKILDKVKPDIIIDFEPYGLETTILSLIGRLKYKIKTVGINEVFPRGLLYTLYAPSTKKFAKLTGRKLPLNYTDRDYVVLYALGIERGNTQIEIKETPKGKEFRLKLKNMLNLPQETKMFGINIGCGTEDAVSRRVDYHLIAETTAFVYKKYGFIPVLFGAPFEKSINEEFLKLFKSKYPDIPVYDIAGKTDILEVVGAINAMELFISSDSGPYHIAVALRKPTVAIFNFDNKEAYHYNDWTKCVVAPDISKLKDVFKAIDEVMSNAKSSNVS